MLKVDARKRVPRNGRLLPATMGANGMRRNLATSSSCEQHYMQAAYAEASRGASTLHRHFGPAPAAEALQALAA